VQPHPGPARRRCRAIRRGTGELCEDLAPLLTELRNCRLPVALRAFASEVAGFPKESAPLSVIAPITEASAEYQAIAYALETPGVELVTVPG